MFCKLASAGLLGIRTALFSQCLGSYIGHLSPWKSRLGDSCGLAPPRRGTRDPLTMRFAHHFASLIGGRGRRTLEAAAANECQLLPSVLVDPTTSCTGHLAITSLTRGVVVLLHITSSHFLYQFCLIYLYHIHIFHSNAPRSRSSSSIILSSSKMGCLIALGNRCPT